MMKDSDDTRKLAEILKNVRIAMLTSVDDLGRLHSRPMAMQRSDFDGDLWFFSRAHGGKIREITRDAHVNLACAFGDDHRYASITGLARITHDDTKMRQLWDPAFAEFFPRGLSDPDLALLKVEVESVEYWSAPVPQATGSAREVGFNRSVMTSRASAKAASEVPSGLTT